MPSCSIYYCKNTHKTKGPSFLCFPKDAKTSQKWVEICNRSDYINIKYARVCSDHFCESDYKRNLQSELLGVPGRKVLKEGVVPSLKITAATSDKSEQIQQVFIKEEIKQELQDPDYDPLGQGQGTSSIEVTEPVIQNVNISCEDIKSELNDEISTNPTKAKRKRSTEEEDSDNPESLEKKKLKLKSRQVDALERIATSLNTLCEIMKSRP